MSAPRKLLCTGGCGVPVDPGWSERTGRTAHPNCEAAASARVWDELQAWRAAGERRTRLGRWADVPAAARKTAAS